MTSFNYSYRGYRYGFNGKENDNEVKDNGNSVDFGARILDPRLGRWLSVDPLQAKYPNWSSYNCTMDNPILFIDLDGREVFIYGVDAIDAVTEIQKVTSLKLEYDVQTNQLKVTGDPQNAFDQELLEAANNKSINVNLYTTKEHGFESKDGQLSPIMIGAYDGSEVVTSIDKESFIKSSGTDPCSKKVTIEATQVVNVDQAKLLDQNGVEEAGLSILHELIEAYTGAKLDPGGEYSTGYQQSHDATMKMDDRQSTDIKMYVIQRQNVDEYGMEEKSTGKKIKFSDSNTVNTNKFKSPASK